MFSWIRHYMVEVYALPSALLVCVSVILHILNSRSVITKSSKKTNKHPNLMHKEYHPYGLWPLHEHSQCSVHANLSWFWWASLLISISGNKYSNIIVEQSLESPVKVNEIWFLLHRIVVAIFYASAVKSIMFSGCPFVHQCVHPSVINFCFCDNLWPTQGILTNPVQRCFCKD